MLEEIKQDLGDNFNTNDSAVLQSILTDVTTNALFISNRKKTIENIELLSFEIKDCVKAIYLQRGTEDVNNKSQSGLSSTFKNAYDNLRKNIINNGKRVIK